MRAVAGFFSSSFRTLLVHLLLALALCSCSQDDYRGQVETVRIGTPPLEQNALLYVADHEKFFAKNGIRVNVRDCDTGVAAITRLLKGEVDIAGAAEFPVVRGIFQEEDLRIIACVDRFENDYVVGRKDRGITTASDLQGKRVGVALGTINEFYLGRFLALNGMNSRDVTLVDLAPEQYLKAVSGGEVDAVIAWQPYVHRLEKDVHGVMVWPAQSGQLVFGFMVCRSGWLKERVDTVSRFLKALGEAEDYLIRHAGEAKAIVRQRLNYDDSYIESVWPRHHFSLSLDQTLIVAMKDEAQWMINSGLTAETSVPDFLRYIYEDGLKSEKPEAVSIIR